MFSHPDYDGHEALLFAQDAASGLRALIAIHDTTLGPAFGGCRMYPYASEQHAMTDVLRLSRGMTYKAAICELPYGGGKSVIITDPRRDKTPALLHAMGRIIEGLGGHYITADDVGTTLADLAIMREVTSHTAAATAAAQQALPVTAFGVFEALRASHGLQSPRARAREFVTTAEYKAFAKAYIEVQIVYRLHSPASAAEICRLSVEAENKHVRAVCGQMVLERAWGKPREYDPNAEAPKKPPPFDPKLYTTDELRRMQEVMLMIARRQGLVPEERHG
jgi:hypothetical protein